MFDEPIPTQFRLDSWEIPALGLFTAAVCCLAIAVTIGVHLLVTSP